MRSLRPLLAAATLLLGLASSAAAQITVFEDDFELGLGDWTTSGLWHELQESHPCGQQVAPFPSSDACAYFGDFDCFFLSNWKGDLTQVTPVTLPAWAESATLRFMSREEAECDSCAWDWRFVYASGNGGLTWIKVGEGTQTGAWYEKTVDLSAFIGQDVLVRFHFDAVDGWANEYHGWCVDDVRIEVEAPAAPGTYCTAKVNSQGCAPYLAWSGDPSLSGSGHFVVRAFDVLDHAPGHFIWSLGFAALPFQGGTICVQTPAFRTTVKSSGGSAGTPCSGGYIHLFSHAFLDAHGVPPGATVFVQCRSRDWGLPPGQHASLSNALYFTRLP